MLTNIIGNYNSSDESDAETSANIKENELVEEIKKAEAFDDDNNFTDDLEVQDYYQYEAAQSTSSEGEEDDQGEIVQKAPYKKKKFREDNQDFRFTQPKVKLPSFQELMKEVPTPEFLKPKKKSALEVFYENNQHLTAQPSKKPIESTLIAKKEASLENSSLMDESSKNKAPFFQQDDNFATPFKKEMGISLQDPKKRSYEDLVRQMESSNKIIKRADQLMQKQKDKKKKRERRKAKDQTYYNSETYLRLRNSIEW